MDRQDRAKQFLSFDALKGLREELKKREERHIKEASSKNPDGASEGIFDGASEGIYDDASEEISDDDCTYPLRASYYSYRH